MPRVIVVMSQKEKDALVSMAEREFRDPRNQAALLIRLQLQQQGYLEPDKEPSEQHNATTD